MTPVELRALLEAVREGRTEPELAHRQLLGALRDLEIGSLSLEEIFVAVTSRQGRLA